MGVPVKDDNKEVSAAQARRDAHYFEQGISARHELEGAQYKKPAPKKSDDKKDEDN